MNEQTSELREAMLDALGVVAAEADPAPARRTELERRRRELAPEALAEDDDALAELEQLDAELAALDRYALLSRLAADEQAVRDRAAADAEQERRRAAWRAEQEQAEAERDAALARFERALTTALDAAAVAIERNATADELQGSIEPGSGYRRLHREVESRLVRRIHETLGRFGVKPDLLVAGEGIEPLVPLAHDCAICRHEHREEIEAAVANGETLQSVVERFRGFSKATLSRHGAHIH